MTKMKTQRRKTAGTPPCATRHPFKVTEVDGEGWKKFKELEAKHRKAYAASGEALADHAAWVDAPKPKQEHWQSIPPHELAALEWPKMLPHPDQPPLEKLKDFCRPSRNR